MLSVAMEFYTCGLKIEHFGIPAKIIHPKNEAGQLRNRGIKKIDVLDYVFILICLKKQKKQRLI